MTSRQYSSLLSSPLNKLLPSKPALLSATAVDVPAMFETKCQRAGVWPAGCPGLLAWSWIFAVFSQSEGGERLVLGERSLLESMEARRVAARSEGARLLDVFGDRRLKSFAECEGGDVERGGVVVCGVLTGHDERCGDGVGGVSCRPQL
jgi:hypothetical protein